MIFSIITPIHRKVRFHKRPLQNSSSQETQKRFQKLRTHFLATQETQQELQNEEHKRELVIKENVVTG